MIDRYDVNDALTILAGGRLSDDDLNDLTHLVSDAIDAGSYCEKCSGPCQET